MAAAVAADSEILERLASCPPRSHDPNLLLGAVQYLILGGSTHPLAALYKEEEAVGQIGPLFHDFCLSSWEQLRALLETRHVQTNECGRCSAIALGVAAAATIIGEPIALVDAGASAGLNLVLDEYLLDFGAHGSIGPAGSPVRIACEVRGGELPILPRLPAIAERVGIDREPVDLSDPDGVRWLLACTWPGTGRHQRTAAAIDLAAARPSLIRKGDMVDDLGAVLEELGDRPPVVVTSWSYSYLPPERRALFESQLAAAARNRPLAWVYCDGAVVAEHDRLLVANRFAPPGDLRADLRNASILGVATFRTGGEVEAKPLAYLHAHGTWIEPIQTG